MKEINEMKIMKWIISNNEWNIIMNENDNNE